MAPGFDEEIDVRWPSSYTKDAESIREGHKWKDTRKKLAFQVEETAPK